MSKRATTDQNTEERTQNTNAMAQENFKKENPFQSLDLSRFPKKKAGTRQESRTSKKHFKLADNVARDEDSFAELMRLSGVETLPPKGIVSEPSRSANEPARGSSSTREPHPQEQANGAKDKKTDHETRTILKTAGLEFRGFDDNFRDPPFSTMGEARGFADLEKTRKQGSAKKTAPLESRRAQHMKCGKTPEATPHFPNALYPKPVPRP